MKFLPYSVIALALVVAIAVAALSVPRVAAYAILFPEKGRLNNPLTTKAEAEHVLAALDAAISWWDAPDFFYEKETFIGAQRRNLTSINRKEYYGERISLIEKGLARGAVKPYKLARLARLHILFDNSYKIGLAALQLSVDTGVSVRKLYMPRFKTLYALWPKMSRSEQVGKESVVLKAVNYNRRALIKFAKGHSRARVMVRESLKDNPAEFLQYVRDYLRR